MRNVHLSGFGITERPQTWRISETHAQQHRGQEGAGCFSLDHVREAEFHVHKGLGLVAQVFEDYDFTKLPGSHVIGHARYTTAGGNFIANV